MNFLALLGDSGFIKYSKELAHATSTNAAIIFGQLCSSYNSYENKGMLTTIDDLQFFYITSDALFQETALSYKQQKSAIDLLEKEGYIKTEKYGVPAKKYYHITKKIFFDFLGEIEGGNPSIAKMEKLKDTGFSEDENAENLDMSSFDKREILEQPKGKNKDLQKGGTLKRINKKELSKKNIDDDDDDDLKEIQVNEVHKEMEKIFDFVNERNGLRKGFESFGMRTEILLKDCAKYLIENNHVVLFEQATKEAIDKIVKYVGSGGKFGSLGALIGKEIIQQHAILHAALKIEEERAAREAAAEAQARQRPKLYNWLDEREQ